jgi:prolyl 4-hydroxylase
LARSQAENPSKMMDPLLIALALASVAIIALATRSLVIRRNRRRYSVKEIPSFLSSEECEHLIRLASPLIERSPLVRKGHWKSNSAIRTSESAFFTDSRDSVVLRIKQRVAETSGTDLRCQEPLQVTHYNETEYFAPHRDAVTSGGVELGAAGDRYCTMIMYLNDDFTGGHTRFHKIGVRVEPERGKAVLFNNLTDDGLAPHPLSLHGASAVRSGDKWLLNQWIRQRPFAPANRSSRRARSKNKKNAPH